MGIALESKLEARNAILNASDKYYTPFLYKNDIYKKDRLENPKI